MPTPVKTLLIAAGALCLILAALALPRAGALAPAGPTPDAVRPPPRAARFAVAPFAPAAVDLSAHAASSALTVATALSHPVLAAGEGREVYAQVLVSAAPGLAGSGRREPVHLALVLDASGSMRGEKIERTRAAAKSVLAELRGGDRFTVVSYESRARVVVPSTLFDATALERAQDAIDTIEAYGSTNLAGGIALAAEQLRGTERRVRRLVLLSDGQANIGEIRPEALYAWAAEQRAKGVGLSAIGVGLDFNGLLMQGLAEHGGGRFRFLEDPKELAGVFTRELELAASLVASAVRLHLESADGARLEEVYGYPFTRTAKGAIVELPDLASSTTLRVLARFSVDARPQRMAVAEAAVSFTEVATDRAHALARGPALVARGGAAPAEMERAANGEVLAQGVNARGIADAKRAVELYNQGKQQEALRAIDSAMTGVEVANRDLKHEGLRSSAGVFGNLRSLFASSASSLGGSDTSSVEGSARARTQRKALSSFSSNNYVRE